ncbi:MAG TPA: hypothetical protein VFS64_05775 [Solirubrobacterales bacterium]|nr:hypothetical protein [Solirubrobacterales bacterium]
MGKIYEGIDEHQREWIAEQPPFFVGSAPLDGNGHGVPLMSYEGERPHMEAWAEKKLRVGGEAEIGACVAAKSAEGIDGLPAF